MPMNWDEKADAKLFAYVLKLHDIKVNYPALAEAMGSDCTPKAITHRIAKIKSSLKDGANSGTNASKAAPDADAAAAVENGTTEDEPASKGKAKPKATKEPKEPKQPKQPKQPKGPKAAKEPKAVKEPKAKPAKKEPKHPTTNTRKRKAEAEEAAENALNEDAPNNDDDEDDNNNNTSIPPGKKVKGVVDGNYHFADAAADADAVANEYSLDDIMDDEKPTIDGAFL
ncbi:choline dehydrogenase 7 [Bachmanniomyces sp. S44760]|nr:choline dehydrogenase 7 [Bachmanniomyces sp. S44760]